MVDGVCALLEGVLAGTTPTSARVATRHRDGAPCVHAEDRDGVGPVPYVRTGHGRVLTAKDCDGLPMTFAQGSQSNVFWARHAAPLHAHWIAERL